MIKLTSDWGFGDLLRIDMDAWEALWNFYTYCAFALQEEGGWLLTGINQYLPSYPEE